MRVDIRSFTHNFDGGLKIFWSLAFTNNERRLLFDRLLKELIKLFEFLSDFFIPQYLLRLGKEVIGFIIVFLLELAVLSDGVLQHALAPVFKRHIRGWVLLMVHFLHEA